MFGQHETEIACNLKSVSERLAIHHNCFCGKMKMISFKRESFSFFILRIHHSFIVGAENNWEMALEQPTAGCQPKVHIAYKIQKICTTNCCQMNIFMYTRRTRDPKTNYPENNRWKSTRQRNIIITNKWYVNVCLVPEFKFISWKSTVGLLKKPALRKPQDWRLICPKTHNQKCNDDNYNNNSDMLHVDFSIYLFVNAFSGTITYCLDSMWLFCSFSRREKKIIKDSDEKIFCSKAASDLFELKFV